MKRMFGCFGAASAKLLNIKTIAKHSLTLTNIVVMILRPEGTAGISPGLKPNKAANYQTLGCSP